MNSGRATIIGSLSMRRFCHHGRQIAEEKLGRHRRVWRDLISMSRQCYTVRLSCLLWCFFFLYFCSFLNYDFFQNDKRMLFQCDVQGLFSVDVPIVLSEENTAKNPEFNYDRFELADMDNSECRASKLHFKTEPCQSQLHLPERFCCSQRLKEENHEDVHGKQARKQFFWRRGRWGVWSNDETDQTYARSASL